MATVALHQIAYARSGDKGSSANVGVIARSDAAYRVLKERLTADTVATFFRRLPVTRVDRFEMDNLGALNFVLHDVLEGGGSVSLRIDAQGKALGQAILDLELEVPESFEDQLT